MQTFDFIGLHRSSQTTVLPAPLTGTFTEAKEEYKEQNSSPTLLAASEEGLANKGRLPVSGKYLQLPLTLMEVEHPKHLGIRLHW